MINVIDEYQELSVEEIRACIEPNKANFSVLVENLKGGLNLGIILRLGNAFGAHDVFYYGNKHWDRRSSVGVQNYTNVSRIANIEALRQTMDCTDVVVIGIDNIKGSVDIEEYLEKLENNMMEESIYYNKGLGCGPRMPEFLLIFGEEESGISQDLLYYCDHLLSIKQFGSVRSLNVSSAAAIVLYRFRQFYDRWKYNC